MVPVAGEAHVTFGLVEQRHHAVDGGLRRVHRRHDAIDLAAILHLQPVPRARIVRHVAHLQVLVEVGHQLLERHDPAHSAISFGRSAGWSVPAMMESVAAASRAANPSGKVPANAGFGW